MSNEINHAVGNLVGQAKNPARDKLTKIFEDQQNMEEIGKMVSNLSENSQKGEKGVVV